MSASILGLRLSLEKRLHGQHLVIDTVVKAVRGHVRNRDPEKALVLSFHGWTGGGKNFVSRILAEHLFKKGMESTYVHQFVATLHFPHESRLETYKVKFMVYMYYTYSKCIWEVGLWLPLSETPHTCIACLEAGDTSVP